MAEGRILGLGPKAARRALVASLVVNCLLLGLAAGAVMKSGGEKEGPRVSSFQLSRQIVEAAGEDRRETVRALMEGARGESWREASIRRWEEVARRVGEAQFDAAAMSAMLTEEMERRAAAHAARNAAMVEALMLLTEAERARLSAAMTAHLAARMERGR